MNVGIAGSFRLVKRILSFSNDVFSNLIKWHLSDASIQISTTSLTRATHARAFIHRRLIKVIHIVRRNHN